MATVSVDQARPGMVLLGDVKDNKGRLLIPAGNELSDRHCQALKMWGVTSLDVEGDEPEGDALLDISPEILAEAEVATDAHLGTNDPSHPLIAALRPILVKNRAEGIAREGAAA